MAELDPALARLLFEPAAQGSRWRQQCYRWRQQCYRCWDAGLDLLFPPHCASCHEPLPSQQNKALCHRCALEIRWIKNDYCQSCGDSVGVGSGVVPDCPVCRANPLRFIQATAALAHYQEGPLRQLILAWKFGRQHHLARMWARLLAWRLKHTGVDQPGLVIVPIPLTHASRKSRGFNQTEELGFWLAKELKHEMHPRLLQKIRNTPPQATLTHTQRRENLTDAFQCNLKLAARYQKTPLLLLDDVITTGSTVSECARVLNAAGLPPLRAASVARG